MATPWDRIDDGFRSWLTKAGTTAEEYNRTSLTERMDLLNSFNRGQQKQQQPPTQIGELRGCFHIYCADRTSNRVRYFFLNGSAACCC